MTVDSETREYPRISDVEPVDLQVNMSLSVVFWGARDIIK